MKISELEAGKTYYHHRKIKRGRTSKTLTDTVKIFVLEINQAANLVHASCNGAAPTWLNKGAYRHWTKNEASQQAKKCLLSFLFIALQLLIDV